MVIKISQLLETRTMFYLRIISLCFNDDSCLPIGPRLEQTRPMDKQSVRSYPGDRDSVRSGRRSRRGDDSSSGYSDNERRYRR